MTKYRLLPALAAVLFMAGCQLSPVDTGRAYMFALRPDRAPQQAQKSLPVSLTIGLPTAPDALDTYRVALLRDGKVWDYYAGTRWADFLTGMVQDSLVKTIEDAHIFDTVATDEAGLSGGLILKPEIRAFNADYKAPGAAPVVHVRIAATLLTDISRKTLYSFTAAADRQAAADSLPAIQAAFQAAYLDVEKSIVAQLAAKAAPAAAQMQPSAIPVKEDDDSGVHASAQ